MDEQVYVSDDLGVIYTERDERLAHYGLDHIESKVGRGSGRYGFGTGKNPGQHKEKMTISEREKDLRSKHPDWDSRKIANELGFTSTTTLVRAKSAETKLLKAQHISEVTALRDKGLSIAEIERQTGYPSSTIRDWLKPSAKAKSDAQMNIAHVLAKELDTRKDILGLDIGLGSSNIMGVSKDSLASAVEILKQEGYVTHKVKVMQQASGNLTEMYVLSKPDVAWKDIKNNPDKIGIIYDTSSDKGHTLENFYNVNFDRSKMESIDSKKIMVRYGEEGGKNLDGMIEIRPGAKGLDMGANRYSQVRIPVDDTHYMKGMAVYGDPKDFPKGIDVIYNSNKPKGTPLKAFDEDGKPGKFINGKECVLKPLDLDPEAPNPFGSTIKRDGQRGYLNIVNEQGDWKEWSKNLSAQFLSKQPEKLIKEQLAYKKIMKEGEFSEIKELTQPEVKRQLLLKFADKCDSDAVELKAAPMSGQSQAVLIGLKSIKDNEIYAPGYSQGDTVVLIRYPHAGQFEIPELKVNNHNREGNRIIGNSSVDAVGVSSRTAAILSGADYDGDSVVVIRNNDKRVHTHKPYEELINFDTQTAYPGYEGMERVGPRDKVKKTGDGFNKQLEMGTISNLITDMTIKGAAQGAHADEIIRAVKYSMVVIDAEKHQLDWKRAKKELKIDELRKAYSGVNENGQIKGASTIISRASSQYHIPRVVPNSKRINKDGTVSYSTMDEDKRVWYSYVDKETGKRVFNPSQADIDSGKVKAKTNKRTTKSTKMAQAEDASILSSGTRKESYYVDYANYMKQMAKDARKEAMNIQAYKVNRSAAKTYQEQVTSLQYKYNLAMREKPYERKANAIADVVTRRQKAFDPELREDKDALKKTRMRNLEAARQIITGERKKYKLNLTDSEWEAIQARAISTTRCRNILSMCDLDELRERATPRNKAGLTPAQIATAKRLLRNDAYTIDEVAKRLGVSSSTLYNYVH